MNKTTRQDRMLAILVVVVGAVAGYIYYSQVASNSITIFPPLKADSKDSLSQFKGIDLDFQIFNSARIQNLKTFGNSPVLPGQTGRQDIFANF